MDAELDRTPLAVIRRSYLAWVTMQHRQAEASDANQVHAIQEARLWGCSWQEIGEALGMTRQAAHKRFARFVEGEAERSAG